MKELFKKYEMLEAEANRADDAWGADPENEQLEAEFDRAYQAEHEAFTELVNAIVKLSGGQIEHKTAAMMIRAKRNELKTLIEKIA